MDIKETVISLSQLKGASGYEISAAEKVHEMFSEYCKKYEIVGQDNYVEYFGEYDENLPLLVLDAHIDQVGMIVTYVTDDGFVKVSNIGGLDRRLLPAQPVVIHGKKDIKGVICSVPPHLTSGGTEVLSWEDVSIDTGMTKDELEKYISLGDSVTYDVKCRELLGNRLTGASLDDRCGIASILFAFDMLKGKKLKYNVAAVLATQEELGERGAKICAYAVNPDIAIAVDVSFAYAIGEDERKCGKLGEGAMIGISPSLSREISDNLINTAKKNNIPYQIEVMEGLTSTNADRYSVSRGGVKTCTVSIPLRNMHTPVEVIDLKDIELTAELLADFIKED